MLKLWMKTTAKLEFTGESSLRGFGTVVRTDFATIHCRNPGFTQATPSAAANKSARPLVVDLHDPLRWF